MGEAEQGQILMRKIRQNIDSVWLHRKNAIVDTIHKL